MQILASLADRQASDLRVSRRYVMQLQRLLKIYQYRNRILRFSLDCLQ